MPEKSEIIPSLMQLIETLKAEIASLRDQLVEQRRADKQVELVAVLADYVENLKSESGRLQVQLEEHIRTEVELRGQLQAQSEERTRSEAELRGQLQAHSEERTRSEAELYGLLQAQLEEQNRSEAELHGLLQAQLEERNRSEAELRSLLLRAVAAPPALPAGYETGHEPPAVERIVVSDVSTPPESPEYETSTPVDSLANFRRKERAPAAANGRKPPEAPMDDTDWVPGRRRDGSLYMVPSANGDYELESDVEEDQELPIPRRSAWWQGWKRIPRHSKSW